MQELSFHLLTLLCGKHVAILFRDCSGVTCGAETLLGSIINTQVPGDWDAVIF